MVIPICPIRTPASSVAETTPTQPPTPAPVPAAGSDPTTVPPPPAADELSYFNRLEKSNAAPSRNSATIRICVRFGGVISPAIWTNHNGSGRSLL
jgi:hypothetical protein